MATFTDTEPSAAPSSVGPFHVAELWRYPVKSLAGEQIGETDVSADGIAGDRLIHVRRADGRVVTSRTHPRLLGLHGTLAADGAALIDGLPWDDPAALAAVRDAAGDTVGVLYDAGPQRFDILPLSILTDGAAGALGVDHRRLRPNIVIGGVAGLAERAWEGRTVRIGTALVELVQLRPRCVMTTFDPDTLEQDHGVLRRIVRDFDGKMALDAAVLEPGRIRVGDAVTLLD
jgi:uncharacterized protein YcbX